MGELNDRQRAILERIRVGAEIHRGSFADIPILVGPEMGKDEKISHEDCRALEESGELPEGSVRWFL